MKSTIAILVLIAIFALSCAAPRGDGAKIYHLNVYANCYAENCNITQIIDLDLSAEVKKNQKAEATQ